MINESNLVSVIVSTYKRNDLLRRCIKSILSNEFVGEVIVVHDGPSIEYMDLATSLKSDSYFDRVKFDCTTYWAGRPAPARNRGVKLAKFSFIAFCDDDDIWEANHLASSVNILLSDCEVDLVFHNPSIMPSTENVSLNNLFFFNFLWQSSCVARFNIKINRLFFYNESPSHKAIEDYMLWIRLLVSGVRIKYLNCSTVVYSESMDSIRYNKIKTNIKILRAFFVDYGFMAIPMVIKWITLRIFYVTFTRQAVLRLKTPSSR